MVTIGAFGVAIGADARFSYDTGTLDVQKAQRRASMGISLRHSGHFFVVGSAGAGALRIRETSALTGVTTKK